MLFHKLRWMVIRNGHPTFFCKLLPYRIRRLIIAAYFRECQKKWSRDLKTFAKVLKKG